MLLNRTEDNGIVRCVFDSSNILESTFNNSTSELIITFKSGFRYGFASVSKTDYMRFEMAESQGKIFNSHIKKYNGVKVGTVDPTKIISEALQLHSLEKIAEYNSRRTKLNVGLAQVSGLPFAETPEGYSQNVSTFVSELEKLKIVIDTFIKDFKTI